MMILFKHWQNDTNAVAATEAALVFPVLLTLLLGVFDIGNAILANQKTLRASQITADLITRMREVEVTDINEAFEAGRISMMPLENTSYGVDIVSIRFDDDAQPQIVWRETRNMTPVPTVLDDISTLASPNEGVVFVASNFQYEPIFSGFVIDTVPMQEVAYARGRLSPVVCQIGVAGC